MLTVTTADIAPVIDTTLFLISLRMYTHHASMLFHQNHIYLKLFIKLY